MLQQLANKRPQDVGSARMLAKELVRARKQRTRMHQSKATLNSIQMQLQEQIGMVVWYVDWYSDIQDQWDSETVYRGYERCEFSRQDSWVESAYAAVFDGVDKGVILKVANM